MSSDVAVRVENLGKRYVIGRQTVRAESRAGRLRQVLASPFGWLSSQVRGPTDEETLWALRDVCFEVKRGEVLGVVGRNGAGKSTLLKILSRITEPTVGRAEVHGRVGSLLEVGTGMHPELTGRENVYLNGTILGMRKVEIDGKFDEIVEFSGISRFLDTPVKRYSSGMRVRLGFAIAAHLEPEILVIDEVLAVGDADFQRKCLGKMRDVAGHGRTVLFVSHNLAAVRSLCTRALLLADGKSLSAGPTDDILDQYTAVRSTVTSTAIGERTDRKGSGELRFSDVLLNGRSANADGTLRIASGEDAVFTLRYTVEAAVGHIDGVAFSIDIRHPQDDRNVLLFRTDFEGHVASATCPCGEISCRVPRLPLAGGQYHVQIFAGVRETEILDQLKDACILRVESGGFFPSGSEGLPTHCSVLHRAKWDMHEC